MGIKIYNTGAKYSGNKHGGYEDVAMQIPSKYIVDGKIQVPNDYESAKRMFDDIYESGGIPTDNQSLMVNYVLTGAKAFGYIDKKTKQ